MSDLAPHRLAATLPEWHDQADCRGADHAVFFVSQGQSTAQAKRICGGCPVQSECLDWAVENREPLGVWGGMTVRERQVERRRRLVGDDVLKREPGRRGGRREGSGRPPAFTLEGLAEYDHLPVEAVADLFGVNRRTVWRRRRDLAEAWALEEASKP